MNQTIGFIGCGNMGSALAKAAVKAAGGENIYLANRSPEKAHALAGQLHAVVTDNMTIAAECDYIFLGVKPQMMADMLQEISAALTMRNPMPVLITMAAGLSINRIREMAGGDYPVIRIMPNTPSGIGEGMILYCTQDVNEEQKSFFLQLLGAAGILDELPEHLIDAGSAISGCGPAFVYPFIEALADGAVACGLPRGKALTYAAQTLIGAAKMIQETGEHPGTLKDAVCSPGGSTIQGVRILEERGFRGAAMDAVIAAYEKTVELGK